MANVAAKERRLISARRARIESLEARECRSTTTSIDSSFTDLSSYSYFADAQLGDNGDYTSASDLASGAGNVEQAWGEIQWQPDLSTGLDSGWVAARMEVDNDRTDSVSWSVGNTDPVVFSSDPSASLSKVAIRAGVDESGLIASWRDVTVTFYHGNTAGETFSIGTLTADTSTATTNTPKEALAVVTATGSNYNHVVVTGQMRIQSMGFVPAPTDIFCDIHVT